ncbi:uncharacterized protein LOC121748170 isoform X1 [Salvia splendens]|uniref:uncharacterized protein LOC121748170 isoform X1 n=1 Tax=Salvia splendens TaxID=180675 RepID=UPI001C276AD7|nr:uncharacterized protein LOC121748170 isoform X1 [Salvia splendens]
MSVKGTALLKDVPWRASTAAKPIPKIHHSPILRLSQNPYSQFALSVMKHDDPIGSGLGKEAVVEAAGPDCIVPGQTVPIKLLGLKVLNCQGSRLYTCTVFLTQMASSIQLHTLQILNKSLMKITTEDFWEGNPKSH